jgi:predicted nuclease of predicted toxin-antitoxin system
MPRTIPFHLDENCAKGLSRGLRLHGIDVTSTKEVGLIMATDEVQLEFASNEGRVLFTHDSDFLALNASGVAHRGIVYSRQGSHTMGEEIQAILLIWNVYDPEDMDGRVEYI